MLYASTRGEGPATLDEALVRGIAGDGGLYLPESLPDFGADHFTAAGTLPRVAAALLGPFFAEWVYAEDRPDRFPDAGTTGRDT